MPPPSPQESIIPSEIVRKIDILPRFKNIAMCATRECIAQSWDDALTLIGWRRKESATVWMHDRAVLLEQAFLEQYELGAGLSEFIAISSKTDGDK